MTALKPYSDYRPSGVERLGCVPPPACRQGRDWAVSTGRELSWRERI